MDSNNCKKSNTDETDREKVPRRGSALEGHKRGPCHESSGGNPKIYRPHRRARKTQVVNARRNQSGRRDPEPNPREEEGDDGQRGRLIGGVMCHGRVHSVAQRRQWRRRPF